MTAPNAQLLKLAARALVGTDLHVGGRPAAERAAAVEVDRARGADAAVAVAAAKQHGIIELVATHRALQRLLPQVRSRRSVRPIECTELRA
jgi:hypothetical protein